MQQLASAGTTVHTTLEYLLPGAQRPRTYMYPPPWGGSWENAFYQRIGVAIADARAVRAGLSIDREGFELRDAPTAVRDFHDKDEVLTVYYPEVAALALAATGASRAVVFDHLLRKREPGLPAAFGRRDGHRPGAAGRVHCDFTAVSARRRLELELGPANAATVRRYSIVNLWRSIRHPVLDAPLAVCDARTVAGDDLVASDILYPERAGEIYQVLHRASHEWVYFSAMTREEVLIFKQFDSNPAVAGPTPHAAFEHPAAPAGAPLRESIEIRCLLVFD
ncbi:MAG: CmcJ/NvfI family oxidoreductase [Massilia sp.]